MPERRFEHATLDSAAETAAHMAETRALLKTGALQNAILNSGNFSSIATDEKGVIQIFSIGAERMLGYKAADVLNKITPADISDPQEVIARAEALSLELGTSISPGFEALVFNASRGINDSYELTYVRKDGSRIPAIVSVTALYDAQNSIIGYLLIGTDDTARQQAETERRKLLEVQEQTNRQLQQTNATLQISEERLAVTLDSIGDAVIATDAEARVTVLNPLAEKLTGWTKAEAIGRPVGEIFHIIDQETLRPIVLPVNETLAHGVMQYLSKRAIVISRHGNECAIADSCAPIRDHDGNVIGTVLVFRDITNEYLVQQTLRDNVAMLQTILNTVVDGIITVRAGDNIIETANPAAEKIFGYPAIDLVGQDFNMLIPEIDRDTQHSFIEYFCRNNELCSIGFGREATGLRKDGSTFPMEFAVSEMWLRGQRYFTGIVRDITERNYLDKLLQDNTEELTKAKSAAEKANLAKSDFLSRMSHELRTPLNAILGFAQLLLAGTPAPTDAQNDKLLQITKAGWYLLELINEILDLAVIESGKLSLSREAVSLIDIMQECQAMVDSLAQEHEIHLHFSPFDQTWFANGDRTRIKEVLVNLLSNAVKYNSKHGSVVVECTESTPGRIRISIKDQGTGLSPEKMKHLFQPFNRLGQENGPEEGTGMGLVVAKQLTELMGGSIGVESTVGIGSTFWIELIRDFAPQQTHGNATSAESMPQVPANAPPRTLLYVEDNPANLMLVEHIVEKLPHTSVLAARDGTLGIAMARTRLPDVILLDINLPDLNGIEVLKLLLRDAQTRHIPVIALSANAMQSDIERGLETGFFRYLTKPIKVNELLNTLEAALKYSKTNSDNANEQGKTS